MSTSRDFPFLTMFLVTSIAMLPERTSGMLERLLTLPLGKLVPLFGYGIAFGAAASVQAALAAGVAFGLLGLESAGSTWPVLLIAVTNAVLSGSGASLQRLRSQRVPAVQFLLVVVLPQILLCGFFVLHDQMAGGLWH